MVVKQPEANSKDIVTSSIINNPVNLFQPVFGLGHSHGKEKDSKAVAVSN